MAMPLHTLHMRICYGASQELCMKESPWRHAERWRLPGNPIPPHTHPGVRRRWVLKAPDSTCIEEATRSRERRSRDRCPGTGRAPTPASPRTGQAPDPGRPGSLGSGRPRPPHARLDTPTRRPAPPELTTAEWAACSSSPTQAPQWSPAGTWVEPLPQPHSPWPGPLLLRVGVAHGSWPPAPLQPASRSSPPGPELAGTPDRTVRPAGPGSAGTQRPPSGSPAQEDSPGRPCSQRELPRGVLLRDPRLVGSRHP